MKTQLQLSILIIFQCLIIQLSAQNVPTKQWDVRFGGTKDDYTGATIQTLDGGYLISGWTYSGAGGDKTDSSQGNSDYWIVKTNANGIKQWDKRYGGHSSDELNCAQHTSDGGFILGGTSASNISGDKTTLNKGVSDLWIVKTDSNGVKEWDADFGGSLLDELLCVYQTADGGYILGGYSRSGISGDKTQTNWDPANGTFDYWIVKTDGGGHKQWDARFGGTGNEICHDIKQTAEGGYILAGTSDSGISGDKTQPSQGSSDMWIVKIDANGIKEWDQRLGGPGTDNGLCIIIASEGGFLIGGNSYSGIGGDKTQPNWNVNNTTTDYWLVKANANGTKQWDVRFGGTESETIWNVIETKDGGYILGGYSESGISGDKTQASQGDNDYWLVKIDANGIKQWDARFGGDRDDELFHFSLKQTSDNGYILAGDSRSGISGDKTQDKQGKADYWLVKLSCETPTVSISPDEIVNSCKGDPITFTASGTAIASYQWYKDGLLIAGATNAAYSATDGTSFYVIADNGSCSTTSATTTVVRNKKPPSTITALGNLDICETGSVILQANAGPGLTYQWKKGNVNIPGEINQTYTATTIGTYKVIVTKTVTGCSKVSQGVTVTKSCKEISLTNTGVTDVLTLYPNPTNGKFIINLRLNNQENAEAIVEIMNVVGQVICATSVTVENSILNKEITLDHSIAEGMYLLKVIVNDKVFTKQLICRK